MTDLQFLGLIALALLGVLLLLFWLRGRPKRPEAVVDGSNVMFWLDNTPRLDPVSQVLRQLDEQGYKVGVIFDANAGYKLFGRPTNDAHMSNHLRMSASRVMVVPKGVQADPYLLTYARDNGAIIVSNDRFRDRIADFPELIAPGRLVSGGVRDGKIWLNLPEPVRA